MKKKKITVTEDEARSKNAENRSGKTQEGKEENNLRDIGVSLGCTPYRPLSTRVITATTPLVAPRSLRRGSQFPARIIFLISTFQTNIIPFFRPI